MKTTLSKTEAQKKIRDFFLTIKDKTTKEIKKIKRLAMHYHISLHDYKKLYCKKCFSVFNSKNSEIRIKKGFKIVKCRECGNIRRCKLRANN